MILSLVVSFKRFKINSHSVIIIPSMVICSVISKIRYTRSFTHQNYVHDPYNYYLFISGRWLETCNSYPILGSQSCRQPQLTSTERKIPTKYLHLVSTGSTTSLVQGRSLHAKILTRLLQLEITSVHQDHFL